MRMRLTTLVAAIALLVVGLLFALAAFSTDSGASSADAAQVVVAPSVFVAPGGSDAAACTQLAPCRSLQHAYDVAGSGAAVQVAGGSYGPQGVAGSGTKAVTFVASGTVTIHGSGQVGLQVGVPNVRFDGISVNGDNRAADGVDIDGFAGVQYVNATVSNVADAKGMLIGGVTSAAVHLNDLIDNVTFRDVYVSDDLVHNECVYSQASYVTIRNSRFSNCPTMDVFVTRGDWWGQEVYGGVTLDGNTLGTSKMTTPGKWLTGNNVACKSSDAGCTFYPSGGSVADHYYGLGVHDNMGTQMRSWTIRNNAFAQSPNVPATASSDSVFCGNTGPGLPAGWTTACSGPPPTTTTVPTTTATTTTTPTTTVAVCPAPGLVASQPTDTTIKLGWTLISNATNFRFFKNGSQVSTSGGNVTSVKFGSLPYADTLLGVQTVCGALASTVATKTTFEQRSTR